MTALKPEERESVWPDPPTTPRDVIAGHVRNWGQKLAYDFADTLLTELAVRKFKMIRADDEGAK